MAYDANGFKDAAIESYQAATELDNDELRWPYLLALAHRSQGNLEGAIEAVDIAISRDSNNVPSFLAKGYWLLELGQYENAITVLESVESKVRSEQDTVAIKVGMAQAKLESGQARIASGILDSVPSKYSSHSYIAQLRQRILRELGQVDVGLEATGSDSTFEQLIWSDPIAGEVVEYTRGLSGESLLARELMEVGRTEDALSLAESLRERYPTEISPVLLLISVHAKMNQPLEAGRVLEKGLLDFPSDYELRFNYALHSEQMQDFDAALKHYRETIKLQPDFLPAYEGAVDLLIGMNDIAAASALLKEAIQLNPSSSLYYKLGVIDGSQGNWLSSLEYLEAASKLDEDHAAIFAHLALSLGELGRFEEALDAIEKARSIDAENDTVVLVLQTLIENGVLERTE